jgi:predicted small integral membrane protein
VEISLLFGQTLAVWLIAFWIGLGVLENIRNPAVNRDMVVGVMTMAQMKAVYPEIHEVFGRNATHDPRMHRLAFAAIVIAELAVTAVLLLGGAALTLALFGLVGAEGARSVASLGAIGFVGVWGAFLVGGQWYHYWCGYEGSQATHFMAAIWGLATFAILHLPG